jgi:hypothetical protein
MLVLNKYYCAAHKRALIWDDECYWLGMYTDIHNTPVPINKKLCLTDKTFKIVAKRNRAVLLYFPELNITIRHYEDIMSEFLHIKPLMKNVNQLWTDLCLNKG